MIASSSQKPGEGHEGSPSEAPEGIDSADALTSDLWPPELQGNNFYCFHPPSLSWQPQEMNTHCFFFGSLS